MKLNIKIDTSLEEPEALITVPRMSEEVNKIVDYIGKLNGELTVISGVKDDKVEILEQGGLIRAYAEGGKVYAKRREGCIRSGSVCMNWRGAWMAVYL